MRPPATRGMLAEAEQLLHAERDRRAALGLRSRSRRPYRSAQGNGSAPPRRAGARGPTAVGRATPRTNHPRRFRRGGSCPTTKGRKPVRVFGKAPVGEIRPGLALGAAQEQRRGRAIAAAPCSRAGAQGRAQESPLQARARSARPAGTASVCSARTSAPSRRRRRDLSEADARSKACSSDGLDRAAGDSLDRHRASAAPRAGCAPNAARPATSPIARNGSPASASCGSSEAARPFAIRKSPRFARAIAIRSG